MHLQSSLPPTPSTPTPPVAMFSNQTSVFFRPFPSRWGDLPAIEDDPGIAALERETVTKPRPMTVEPTRLFQPTNSREITAGAKKERKPSGLFGPAKVESDDRYSQDQSSSSTPIRFDVHPHPRIIHSLQLTQYIRKMNSFLAELSSSDSEPVGAKRKISSSSSSIPKTPPPLPPLPSSLEAKEKVKKEKSFAPFDPPPAEDELTPFAQGRWASPSSVSSSSLSSAPPPLTNTTCRQLAKKSVVTLIAHAGFDNASEGVLDFLTDLLQSYLAQLMGNLSDARDAEMTSGDSDFPDILERVFAEMGVGSAKCLLRFYKTDVVRRHDTLRRQCDNVTAQYRAMTSSSEAPPSAAEVGAKVEVVDGDSKAWFTTDGGSGVAKGTTNEMIEVAAADAAIVKREFDAKETVQSQLTPSLSVNHSIVPGQTTANTDATDYDADDDDVITEPSSVKSIFENDAGSVICEGGSSGVVADSGYDLVASTLISLASPNSSKGVKKKKKSK